LRSKGKIGTLEGIPHLSVEYISIFNESYDYYTLPRPRDTYIIFKVIVQSSMSQAMYIFQKMFSFLAKAD